MQSVGVRLPTGENSKLNERIVGWEMRDACTILGFIFMWLRRLHTVPWSDGVSSQKRKILENTQPRAMPVLYIPSDAHCLHHSTMERWMMLLLP